MILQRRVGWFLCISKLVNLGNESGKQWWKSMRGKRMHCRKRRGMQRGWTVWGHYVTDCWMKETRTLCNNDCVSDGRYRRGHYVTTTAGWRGWGHYVTMIVWFLDGWYRRGHYVTNDRVSAGSRGLGRYVTALVWFSGGRGHYVTNDCFCWIKWVMTLCNNACLVFRWTKWMRTSSSAWMMTQRRRNRNRGSGELVSTRPLLPGHHTLVDVARLLNRLRAKTWITYTWCRMLVDFVVAIKHIVQLCWMDRLAVQW